MVDGGRGTVELSGMARRLRMESGADHVLNRGDDRADSPPQRRCLKPPVSPCAPEKPGMNHKLQSRAMLAPVFLTASVVLFLVGCLDAAANDSTSAWRTHRVVLPRFFLEYRVPPTLKPGYGEYSFEIDFAQLKAKGEPTALGDGEYYADIGTFYYGLVGEFVDWDATVEISVIKFDPRVRTMASDEELAAYVREAFSQRKYFLKGGRELIHLGAVKLQSFGAISVVHAISAERRRVGKDELKGKTGSFVLTNPFDQYWWRLDSEVVLRISVNHANEKKLSTRWYTQTEELVASLFAQMKVSPREAQEAKQ